MDTWSAGVGVCRGALDGVGGGEVGAMVGASLASVSGDRRVA